MSLVSLSVSNYLPPLPSASLSPPCPAAAAAPGKQPPSIHRSPPPRLVRRACCRLPACRIFTQANHRCHRLPPPCVSSTDASCPPATAAAVLAAAAAPPAAINVADAASHVLSHRASPRPCRHCSIAVIASFLAAAAAPPAGPALDQSPPPPILPMAPQPLSRPPLPAPRLPRSPLARPSTATTAAVANHATAFRLDLAS